MYESKIKSEAMDKLFAAGMLKKGDTYIAVAEKTGASSATISRVNRCLLYGANGYNIAIERENAEK